MNTAEAAAFLAEANHEIRRYCDGGSCRSSGLCAFSDQAGRVDCIQGTCRALTDDGGP
ncbi:MAG: hypothetical protein JNK82_38540 [Myxococcaceae bacterium]|nr:hypothetical protein [Myxococcaceae bacterium]